MKILMSLVNRNRKLFFRDKGMLVSAMITPIILIVLYATFLAKVYRDSFLSNMPETLPISDKLINGTVAGQLVAALLAVVVYVAILISTAVCDVLSYLVKWYLEKEEADKINRRIAEHRRKRENG